MEVATLVGMIAGTLTTVSFLPQVIRTWKTKDVSGLSLGMYSLFTAGVALWVAYGVMLRAWPIIITNGITLLLAAAVLALVIRYGKRSRS